MDVARLNELTAKAARAVELTERVKLLQSIRLGAGSGYRLTLQTIPNYTDALSEAMLRDIFERGKAAVVAEVESELETILGTADPRSLE